MKRFWNRLNATASSSGAANLFAVSYAVEPAAYAAGERFSFKAHQANTGAASFSVNGLPAKSILKPGPSGPAPLAGGEIQPGQIVSLAYDGAQFVMTSPAANQIPASRTIASGNGLAGGGDLSADRVLAVGAGTGIVSNADDVAIDKATQANMEAQTANKVVTADNAKWHPAMPKAWAKFHWNGAGLIADASYGVSGIVRNSTGNYTVSFTTAFSSADYGALVSAGTSSAPASATALVGTQSAGSCVVYGIANAGADLADPTFMYVAFFGDQ